MKAEADLEFLDFIKATGDVTAYLEQNPDVAAANLEGFDHWLRHGLDEGRYFPGIEIKRNQRDIGKIGREWRVFSWRGESIAARPSKILSAKVLDQIFWQSRHDPTVLAPSKDRIPRLHCIDMTDLIRRHDINLLSLLKCLETLPSVVFVIPHLLIGGGEKYASDLVDAIQSMALGQILVIVTDQRKHEAEGWMDLAILSPMRKAQVIFLRDFVVSGGHCNAITLARLLYAFRSRYLVVINSRSGLEAVAVFGRGISRFTRVVCGYFSTAYRVAGVNGITYSDIFARRTIPHSIALTDNQTMAETLRSLYGGIDSRICVVPPRVDLVDDAVFAMRMEARRRSIATDDGNRRWVWVSRVEPFKGTATLSSIAKARPDDQFDVFGPVCVESSSVNLDLPNITLHGAIKDVSTHDFSTYDGFLFTSLFEGMPNVVLEMSQHAIPLILADVGGLRDTLDDKAALFVRNCDDPEQTALQFLDSLDRVIEMAWDEVVSMVNTARNQVRRRHDDSTHALNVASLLGQG